MDHRLVVATTCPTCDAPLDFAEGSNAVQCGYCRSNLLVTGHKQVLSYFIAPKLELQRAVARVMLAHKEHGTPCRVIKPQLYFIPYYRLTGHDFRWESGPRQPVAASLECGVMGLPKVIRAVSGQPAMTFRDRYVEKNFIGCRLHGAGMHSLGVRPAVLRLELFRRAYLESLGIVVPADMTPKQALVRGMKTVAGQPLQYRQVLGQRLSVIYFPYWVMQVKRQGDTMLTIADAVSSKVIKLDAPCSLSETLHRQTRVKPVVIGFRPLACPNCGWDLPLRPLDVIFFCASCDRAWQIYGSELRPVACQVADIPPANPDAPITYLPFWTIQAGRKTDAPVDFFLPAFRYRRLKLLADLARRLATKQPHYELLSGPKPALHSCYYDHQDALKLASFTYVGLQAKRPQGRATRSSRKLSCTRPILTWFPFAHQGKALVDPFTGMSLPHNGLL